MESCFGSFRESVSFVRRYVHGLHLMHQRLRNHFRRTRCSLLPRSTIGCVQNGFLAYAALCANLAPILHRNSHCLQSYRSKITYDTRHLGVPSCASRLISKHLVCSMQTVHLSCIKITTISKQTEPSIHLSSFT